MTSPVSTYTAQVGTLLSHSINNSPVDTPNRTSKIMLKITQMMNLNGCVFIVELGMDYSQTSCSQP
jgi:hypothetical protein